MTDPQPLRPMRCMPGLALVLTALGLLVGCAPAGPPASPDELRRSGWQTPSALAPEAQFEDYVDRVTQELRAHRLPFDPSNAEAELALVAPFRMAADATCPSSEPRGIVVLVHGLSDTPFAMRDLASVFARMCFESRALLLPGHGTRPGDLLRVDHRDWLHHLEAAVAQARRESPVVVLAGFSLGASLALASAAESPGKVDAVIGVSPAYRIRSNFLARQADWMAPIRPWLLSRPREEFARYGSMPTQGISATMAVLGLMDERLQRHGPLQVPWLVVQSEDDEVVDVAANRRLFEARAGHPSSLLVNYFSDAPPNEPSSRVAWTPAASTALRVVGLSHLSLHISPDNPHYGLTGHYRNCGSTPYREEKDIAACQRADQVWYGVGGQSPPVGQAGARSTFNPHFQALERRIGEFLGPLRHQAQAAAAGPANAHPALPH
ncbi:MAG: alpha/beta fold hydrolase [Inhella sp.]|jgi:alpha-beta hydrolase superfamily lysophospholipase|uniref:alpha/beta hydrolase n=1 Tax=Inhella sp. TaxID=1921806 RepID=UPI0022BC6221|nr:alpha/beta hydrolase [Inhella sp.]MCZ8236783.1 alpha/beta fold hydrolase [Inhella sp.]